MTLMAAESQAPLSESSGRANQKRRTRAAIIAAARTILDRGETPTIAQVADEALMTRQTVYRYFSNQESLLLEVSVTIDTEPIDQVLDRLPKEASPQERLIDFIATFNRHCIEQQTLHRTAQRHYLDQWLAAERDGRGHDEPLREGRRVQWIASVLSPALDTLPDQDRQRLEAALGLVTGGEAINVLTDVYHLDTDEIVDVTTWAAGALLTHMFDNPAE